MSRGYGATFNFSSVVRRHAERLGEREAIADVASGRRFTWAELDRRVDATAAALRDSGIGRGDVVGLLLYNCPEFIETVFAVNRIGAVFLPLNWRLAQDEVRYILEHAQARALVTEGAFFPVVEPVAGRLAELRTRFALDDAPPDGWMSFGRAVAAANGARVADAEVGADELHRLMYTSGTTAHPKGVMLSYANLYWKNLAHILEFGITRDDRTLIVGPL